MSGPTRPSPARRRPLPALVFLLALTLLAALVWWRVLDRDDGHAAASPTCTRSPSPSPVKQLPEPAAITVRVLNSTKRSGIATAAQAKMRTRGFQTSAPAANDTKDFPGYHGKIKAVAEIRYGPGEKAGARLVHFYFPGSTLVQTDTTEATVLVSLGEKYKGVASTRHVQGKLKARGITLVPVTGAKAEDRPDRDCATSTTAG